MDIFGFMESKLFGLYNLIFSPMTNFYVLINLISTKHFKCFLFPTQLTTKCYPVLGHIKISR